MTVTRIIGDLHGKLYEYEQLIKDVDASIQLGDFGIGFSSGNYWHDKVNELHSSGKHKFIRGNHDNPTKCKDMIGYIPDAIVQNDVMYLGGAWSIDHAWRTEGVNWWADEELSEKDCKVALEVYDLVRPGVMITHDAPTNITYDMFVKQGNAFGNTMIKTRTGNLLQAMFDIHQPKYHFFGHWHTTKQAEYYGTKFHCLGECDFVDFNMETKEYE